MTKRKISKCYTLAGVAHIDFSAKLVCFRIDALLCPTHTLFSEKAYFITFSLLLVADLITIKWYKILGLITRLWLNRFGSFKLHFNRHTFFQDYYQNSFRSVHYEDMKGKFLYFKLENFIGKPVEIFMLMMNAN